MRNRLASMIILSFFILLLIIVFPFLHCFAASLIEKHVLIMNAHNPSYPYLKIYEKGLKEKFQQASQYQFSYSYEYLDIANFADDKDYLNNTAQYFQAKYAKHQPDIIVTADGLAPFLIQHGEVMFPGVPAVFSWNDARTSIAKLPGEYVAVPEIMDINKSIRLILQTRPGTKKIYILIGDSDYEREIIERIYKAMPQYPQLEFVFMNKLSFQEMIAGIRNADIDSVILYLFLFVDVEGETFIPTQVVQTICDNAPVPVYGTGLQYIGSGIVGGYVNSSEIIGRNIAQVGLDILNGKKRSEIQVTDLPAGEYAFDWRELKRWKISEDKLPAGSRIEYRVLSIWELYKGYIIGGIVLILLETALVLGLFINQRKRKHAYATIAEMSEQLKEQNELKDVFLTNTSHEFKTPLHGIISITQTVQEETVDKVTAQQTENLSLVVSIAQRLSTLVNDILDFEKIKDNDIDLHLKAVDACSIVNAAFEVFRYIVKDNGLRLVNCIPANLPAVQADENRLQQVFYNLIGNAIKFTTSGEVVVSAVVKNAMVYISVIDTGIGIPPEKHEDIFLSFEQVSASRAGEYGGTGLGLAITQQLVERMGGKIWVNWSEAEKGSEFTFTLPISMMDNSANIQAVVSTEVKKAIILPPKTKLHSVKDGEFTLLAVDDEPTNLRVIINVFAQENYDILTASSGAEALRLIKENRKIDMVLLDVMMPGMTGYEVCRQIREEYPLFELPVLLVTVRSLPEEVATGFAAGANDFITKPFDAKEMRARVKTLLELKKAVGNAVRSEVAFLQSQIKPHFFYNVLNTIIAFCYTDSAKAGELLAEFSNYLRRSFDIQDTELFTPLKNEIELVKSYVAIEQARFGDRVVVQYDIDVNLMNCKLPPLIIQPLVENAIRHGVTSREEGGHIKVTIQKEAGNMIIEVVDDGNGMSAERLAGLLENRKKSGSVGLRNINRRLLKFYGQTLRIMSKEGQGTRVILQIPAKCPEFVQNHLT